MRQRATEELEKLGDAAAPALRHRLTQKRSLETRRRIEQILQRGKSNSEAIRTIRAVRVLETIGNAEARRLLEMIATSEPTALPTQAAAAALACPKELEKEAKALEKRAYHLSFPARSHHE